MIRIPRLSLLLIAALITLALSPPPVRVTVSLVDKPDVTLRATLTPHKDNRLLIFQIASDTYSARQDVQLTTAEDLERASFSRVFPRVRPGKYAVLVTVVRAGGKTHSAASDFCLGFGCAR